MDNQFDKRSWSDQIESIGSMVTKPKHYQIFPEKGIEARDIIERVLDLSGLKGSAAFNVGCALKYLLRVGRKGPWKEEVGKTKDYCSREVESD